LQARDTFSDEIDGDDFRIYTLPTKYSSVEEKSYIETEEQFAQLSTILNNWKVRPPCVLIANCLNGSPQKVPSIWESRMLADDDLSSLSYSSGANPSFCRFLDKRCVLCAWGDGQESNIHLTHIFTYEEAGAITDDARNMFLRQMKLGSVNSPANVLSMCPQCCKLFDDNLIVIDPVRKMWLIDKSVRALKSAQGSFYSALQKPYNFRHRGFPFHPSGQLLLHRYARVQGK
jgi:hypothetical protein